MNNVVLIGRLTKDPELRFTAGSGKAVATFTIAVNRSFGRDSQADFIRIVVWEKQGENCANYLSKGSLVGIQGRIQTGSYETNSGERRYTTEVVASMVEFLSGGSGGNKNQGYDNDSTFDGFEEADENIDGFQAIEDDDDIPF